METNTVIINLRDISFSYSGDKPVLDQLSFQLHQGEQIGLVGPNGSGKTTFFYLIMGLLKPSSGSIELFGKSVHGEKDFREARKRIGLLFQDADDQLFSPTVLEDVAFGPLNLGKSPEEAVINSLALEKAAKMAWGTLLLAERKPSFPKYLLEKHYLRKHGPKAYYGQKKGKGK